MIFSKEADFEEAVIEALKHNGWQNEVLKYPTEEDLIQNWANILFDNNKGQDRLNGVELTKTEMSQLLEQIAELKTPLKLNGFINGKTVSITRDNPKDKLHLGKEVSLKIYDRNEIAGGQSRYQIVQQPILSKNDPSLRDRRGDLMLLINGMPVIFIELKKTDIPISNAYNQIEKYSSEGLFTGIFSLIQIFVAMNPDETVYFANPGPDGKFNPNFYFHWANFDNEPLNKWIDITSNLLSIPMAHQLVGFYTVADDADGILKVMRSYQYHASNKISDTVSKIDWEEKHQRGGYIWHTTGSGKTMTSFKSAQLIANSKDADKVVFLMDRVELGTQSLYEYRAFAEETDDVQATENTHILISKLKSKDPSDTLIVTSIQKMSRIKEEEPAEGEENVALYDADIEKIRQKRIVFIVDECHRSTFGEMLITIKETFPDAVFFGFTGTPIYDENKKKDSTTSQVFGDELHRYTIADGIRDKNVLGFDIYKCGTYDENDLRKIIALKMAEAKTEEEVFNNPKKENIYSKYMFDVPMAGAKDARGNYHKGIEDYVKSVQYDRDEHRMMVIKDIKNRWTTLSHGGEFHALFATSSIVEAIKYYRLIKKECPNLKVTALFDSNVDNNSTWASNESTGKVGASFKQKGLVEILQDYNEMYDKNYELATHDKFKKDLSSRLSHKKSYERIDDEQKLDLLIVVDQMLTGFDSKWVNTLYLDKVMKYENIIQAFSRTNRLYGPNKPFGVIRYYRKPFTMERNIAEAIKYYSGDREIDLFVDKLPANIQKINELGDEIKDLFKSAKKDDMESLPDDVSTKAKFAKLFGEMNRYLEAARVQGFSWNQKEYSFDEDDNSVLPDSESTKKTESIEIAEDEYLLMAQRYKELPTSSVDSDQEIPYDIEGYLTQINTERIDNDYMNSRFEKYLRDLEQDNISPEELKQSLNDLHKSFAYLSAEEQKYANIFLHDIESGSIKLESGKSFREYITDYQLNNKLMQVESLHSAIGVDKLMLKDFLTSDVTDLNGFGRFSKLLKTIDKDVAKAYFEKRKGKSLSKFVVNRDATNLLREFVLKGGFDID